MPISEKAVRIFISSTFRDMHAERDHLVTVVFPELRERLDRLGLELYDVDLRWGIPEKGMDGETANSWAYCKQWIERVEPFFISFLGQRYGWIPPECEIQDKNDRTTYKGLSITEMEIRHAVFSGKLNRRCFFYFRQAVVPEDVPAEIYCEFVDRDDQERLRRLKEEIVALKRPVVHHYDCHWVGKGFSGLDSFGQTVLEDLWSGVLRDERYVSKEAWKKVLGHAPESDPLYIDVSQPIPSNIWEKILEAAKPAPQNPLDAESEQMATFAKARLRWFHGRAQELAQLSAFVNDDLPPEASHICVVRAVAGQGKSALLAKLAENLADSSHLVITHFVGATQSRSDSRGLLERLDQELERNGITVPLEGKNENDLEGLHKRFCARLERYEGDRRLVFLIDAVNQLDDEHCLAWLPRRLGPSVRFILSTIAAPMASPESLERRVLSTLKARQPEPLWIDLHALEEEDVFQIVQEYLLEYCKQLDKAQIALICQMVQARNPLYLLVMLNELRSLGGNDMNKLVPQLIGRMKEKYPDTVSLFAWTLERLEVFGVDAVRLWCTYLALGRVGLSSRELSDLLASQLGANSARTALLIERGIRRYLQTRGAQLDFFHGQLREAVRERYFSNPQAEQAGHWQLAEYFHRKADPLGNATWSGSSPRPLTELAFHLVRGNHSNALRSLYTDCTYMEKVCIVCDAHPIPNDLGNFNGVFVLLAGIQDAIRFLKSQPEKEINDLRTFLQAIADVLIDRGLLLRKCPRAVSQEIANYIIPASKAATDLHKSALKQAHQGLLINERILTEPSIPCHSAEITALAVSPSGRQFLSGGADGYVGCWQIDQPRPMWFIRVHKSQITSVSFSPDGHQGLSTGDDGTIFLWDIGRGQNQQLFDEFGDAKRTIQWPYSFGKFLDNNSLFIIRKGAMRFELNPDREIWRNFDISRLVGRGHQRFMDFSSQANKIAIGDGSLLSALPTQIEIFDANLGTHLSELVCPTSISRFALTWDAANLLTADSQGRLTAYETQLGKPIASTRTEPFFGLCRAYKEPAFFAYNRLGNLNKISVGVELKIETRDSLDLNRSGPPEPYVMACLPDNQTLVMGSCIGTLLLVDWKSGRVIRRWESGKSFITGSIFPNRKGAIGIQGPYIAGQPKAGYKLAFVGPSGKRVDIQKSPHTQRIAGVAVIDSQRALTVDKGGTAVIWKGQRAIKVHQRGVDFSVCTAWPETGLGVAGTQDEKILILGEGEQIKELSMRGSSFLKGESGIAALAITGKPMAVFAVYFSGAIRFEQEQKQWRIQGHQLMGSAAALAASSQMAASGNINGEVHIWNCSTGDLEMEFCPHQGEVTALAFDPTGKFLYTAGADRFIYEINLMKGRVARATVLPAQPIALLVESNGWLSTLDLYGNVYRFG